MRSFASKGVPRGYSAPVLAATAQGYAEVLAPDEQLTLRQALAAGAVRTV